MKINFKTLIVSVLIPLAVGVVSGLLSMSGIRAFGDLNMPPLSPPAFLFPIVWTILYILMGISSYLVIQSNSTGETTKRAFKLYALQLFFNFFWSIIFFNLECYGIAFLWLLVLLALIIATSVSFFKINKLAGLLMIPYILWVTFAGYLNLGVAILN